MKKSIWLSALLIAVPLLILAHTQHSPYSGQEQRQIKALSAEDVQAYLTGQGMGFARAAELNSYPGPKHVLELAEQLQLSNAQRIQTQRIRAEMLGEATHIGRLIVERERELDGLFARNEINSTRLQVVVGEIARLQGELRVAHLRAHLEMKRMLSAVQVRRYDELRGYGAGEGSHQHRQHGQSEE